MLQGGHQDVLPAASVILSHTISTPKYSTGPISFQAVFLTSSHNLFCPTRRVTLRPKMAAFSHCPALAAGECPTVMSLQPSMSGCRAKTWSRSETPQSVAERRSATVPGSALPTMPQITTWPRLLRATHLIGGFLLELYPVSYTHLTLPTIYSV